jgi:hypothetical protein
LRSQNWKKKSNNNNENQKTNLAKYLRGKKKKPSTINREPKTWGKN